MASSADSAAFSSRAQPLKGFLQRMVLRKDPPILVSSIGRSGSTLVFNAVSDALAAKTFGPLARIGKIRNLTNGPAFFLDRDPIHPGGVYKTHDLPSNLRYPNAIKAIFVYGPARDAALSVYSSHERFGADWTAQHLRHFRASGDFRAILERDILGFARQIEEWALVPRIETLLVHYDALWDDAKQISEFVGAEVEFPPRRPRKTPEYPSEIVKLAAETYAELDRVIGALPRCQVVRP